MTMMIRDECPGSQVPEIQCCLGTPIKIAIVSSHPVKRFQGHHVRIRVDFPWQMPMLA